MLGNTQHTSASPVRTEASCRSPSANPNHFVDQMLHDARGQDKHLHDVNLAHGCVRALFWYCISVLRVCQFARTYKEKTKRDQLTHAKACNQAHQRTAASTAHQNMQTRCQRTLSYKEPRKFTRGAPQNSRQVQRHGAHSTLTPTIS